MSQSQMGRWAFIIGLVISILLGFVSFSYSMLILVILGLIVGFMNVTEKEAQKYLVAVIALIVLTIRALTRSSFNHSTRPSSDGALEILKERYARGEITKDQYDSMQRDLKT